MTSGDLLPSIPNKYLPVFIPIEWSVVILMLELFAVFYPSEF